MSYAQIGEPGTYTTFNPYTAVTTQNNYQSDVAKSESLEDAKSESEKRLSETNLPEVVPADVYIEGKEVVSNESLDNKEAIDRLDEKEKEVFHHGSEDKEAYHVEQVFPEVDVERGLEAVPIDTEKEATGDLEKKQQLTWKEQLDRRRVCGLKLKWALFALGAILLLIIVLGAGLGAGLSSGGGGPSSGQDESASGAMQGSKLAIVSQSFGPTDEQTLVLYYQQNTGSIRWMQLASNGSWIPGDAAHNLVANDAKTGTPITAVSYTWNGASFWRVYYIDHTNVIREVWMGNATESWTLGPLNEENLSPLDSDAVGMVACWAGPTFGDVAATSHSEELAIRIAYASDAETFETRLYRGDQEVYNQEQTLPNLNGHATPTCYNPRPGTVDYMMFVDLQDNVNVYWRDSDTRRRNTSNYPINEWTNSSMSIPNFEPAASLSFTSDTLYAQGKFDKLIGGYSITFDADETEADSEYAEFAIIGSAGVPGTGLGAITDSDTDDVRVYFQTGGGDILEYRRGSDGGEWSGSVIDLPFD